jgi:hypothetical protein
MVSTVMHQGERHPRAAALELASGVRGRHRARNGGGRMNYDPRHEQRGATPDLASVWVALLAGIVTVTGAGERSGVGQDWQHERA